MSKYKVGDEMIEIDDGMKAEARMMQEALREAKEKERINNTLQVKYIDKNITRMRKIDGGDLVDIRVSKVFDCKYNYQTKKLEMTEKEFPYQYNQGDTLFFKLGFAMKMPPNKKANVYPRSGMFKNYGFLLTNSVGQIDNAFQGNTDEWGAMMYCTRDGEISYDDRILQFEVVNRTMENIKFKIVENLQGEDRGGYSSTGIK
jgi:dUTPase